MTEPQPLPDRAPSPAPSEPAPGFTTAVTVEDFRRNLAAVRARLASAAERAGRDAAEIRLLPVSKTVPEERLRVAHAAGITQMGENKVQEARRKAAALADLGIHWAVIGHLQTNKAKDVAAFADEFQALDSLRVAETLDRRLQAAGRGLDVYVQVNSSGEASKFGLEPADVPAFLQALPAFSSLRVRGLMTLAAHTEDRARIRECFRTMRDLRDAGLQAGTIGDGQLSMGMSGDFELAIEGGSTCVRVGQAIFGPRPTPDSHYWPEAGAAEAAPGA
ncbi:YggS family pyridoxal phosphate-dependent enzyme [Actinomyces israelii]|uniref:YggS family pyridoxal phosphate-dependent enzyme n=1 Tax=Actinomyces israelii TaxID=1659 RepID=UPI002353F138|nr:YggS family pyridoxal phosphate-dependent enzyme [Actinomyces israelii]